MIVGIRTVMRNIRNLAPETVKTEDAVLNVFKAETGDFAFFVRQPRRKDSSRHRKAWKQLSRRTLRRYMRQQYVDSEIYDSKWRCRQPLYRGEAPGFLPLIMVIDGRIVGFGDMMFRYGTEFNFHQLEGAEVGCSMNLCVVDKYQGLGIGSYYGCISVFIAKHFGADYALGYTPIKHGMFNIRMKEGWEYLKNRGGYAVIRKRL